MSEMNPQDYANFLHDIKQQIRDRQLEAIVSGLDCLHPLLCHPHQLKVSGQEHFHGQLLFN